MRLVRVDLATGQGASEHEFDNEAENRRQVAHGRMWTVPQVWEELNASRAHLLEFLDQLTPEQLKRRGTHPGDGAHQPPWRLAGGWWEPARGLRWNLLLCVRC